MRREFIQWSSTRCEALCRELVQAAMTAEPRSIAPDCRAPSHELLVDALINRVHRDKPPFHISDFSASVIRSKMHRHSDDRASVSWLRVLSRLATPLCHFAPAGRVPAGDFLRSFYVLFTFVFRSFCAFCIRRRHRHVGRTDCNRSVSTQKNGHGFITRARFYLEGRYVRRPVPPSGLSPQSPCPA